MTYADRVGLCCRIAWEDLSRRVAPKVSSRKFPFPRLLFEVVPIALAAARRTAGLYTVPNGWSYLCTRPRLEFERPPLRGPGHRKVDNTFEAEASRQASFDRGLDDVGSEEGER